MLHVGDLDEQLLHDRAHKIRATVKDDAKALVDNRKSPDQQNEAAKHLLNKLTDEEKAILEQSYEFLIYHLERLVYNWFAATYPRGETLKISDGMHSKLTSLLGELTAEANKMQTYQDAINALLNESVMLPPELIVQTQNFIEKNKQMGYTTKEEFVRDAIRFRLNWLKSGNECLEISCEQYEALNEAVKEMNLPFHTADQFVNSQIDSILEKYKEYKKNKSR
jgi:hypothetical protein